MMKRLMVLVVRFISYCVERRTGMSEGRLNIGDAAPDFEALTDKGESIRLSDLRGKRVILYFYPKDDTPGCTMQSCGFRDAHPRLEEKNVVVLGVSPDGVVSHQNFKTKYSLPFPLLVDEDHRIAEAYGVWGEKSLYGKKSVGMIRSHFVIDEQGRLIDVQVGVSPLDSVERALKAV
jgi:peroxiredoxin Q/BCP